jgi:NPCBM/NEW2 domain/Chitobiase/beta-hexosaminidase C-terminal domain
MNDPPENPPAPLPMSHLLLSITCVIGLLCAGVVAPAADLELRLQRRDPGSGEVRITTEKVAPAKAGVVIVDMWNWHWCKTSTARVAALVPRLKRAVDSARDMGMTVFWCPSDVADNYIGTAPYEAAFQVQPIPLPPLKELDCPPAPDGGGCTCGVPRCQGSYGWDGMHTDLKMSDGDFMPNDLETLYTLCKQRGLTHIIYAGVHTQVCLLGKSIGLRNMTRAGFRCLLCRDLTDAHGKYDPSAGITPDQFTAEVVRHFEMHLAATIDFADELRRAGRWDDSWSVDPVRITPWGTPMRPHLFENEITVTLAAPGHDKAEIRYTMDGSAPNVRSPLYTAPLTVKDAANLRAAAFEGGRLDCAESNGTFVRLGDMPPKPDRHLVDLQPIRVTGPGHSPSSGDHRFSPVSNPPQHNQSNRKQSLRLRGQEFDRGLGVHAPNQLVYELKPGFERFVALAGADDHLLDVNHGSNLAMKPSVVLMIVIDGRIAATSPVLRISEPPWRFNVEIPVGSRRLSILTTDAGDGNREDLVNWVDAGFVLKKSGP